MKKNLKSKEGLERCPNCGKVSKKQTCGCEDVEEIKGGKLLGDPVASVY
jgi:hypothetical protein